MSEGGFYLSQFKITYNTTNYSSYYEYGCDLLSKYANCIISASQRSDGNWSIDADKTAEADDTVNGVPIYNIQTRIPVWGTAYIEGSYNIGCFLKYDNGTTVRHLFLMLNSCIYYFSSTPRDGSDIDGNSLRFNRTLVQENSAPYENNTTGYPISFGAMCRIEPFNIIDLCDNSKNVFKVSDTPIFPITGSFINSLSWTDSDVNIPFSFKKLSIPDENDSYVLGVCIKNDIIISIFRNSSWQAGNYTCSIFGNIVECYNLFDNKSFAVIQGSCGYYNDWNNNKTIKEIYGYSHYNKVSGCFKLSDISTPLSKDYLTSVISRTTDNTNFCACTTAYLSFIDNIANSSIGSKYKGKINTDVFRECNDLSGSELVLDGNFMRIGCCLIGWDYTNDNLLD